MYNSILILEKRVEQMSEEEIGCFLYKWDDEAVKWSEDVHCDQAFFKAWQNSIRKGTVTDKVIQVSAETVQSISQVGTE